MRATSSRHRDLLEREVGKGGHYHEGRINTATRQEQAPHLIFGIVWRNLVRLAEIRYGFANTDSCKLIEE